MTKEWMTPEQLAIETGYSRQTINKWIKRQGWKTVHKPGVQGGKARLIHIDAEVEQFLSTVRPAAEPIGHYFSGDQRLTALLLSSIDQMSQREKEQLSGLLLREGIRGVLLRLGLLEDRE
ncbi:YfeC-like transcriptional regulator [Tatumella saanichensis]|uniref:YfeC-like transcriptional regulator n=1 Tax=Tatumella saanichensis TaxID=480813 RepID=UPI0004A3CD39|nr:YfeC-like transcriptional regulator [Tatumella saanichensis]